MSSVSVDSARLGKVQLNVEETRITGSLRQQNTRSGKKKDERENDRFRRRRRRRRSLQLRPSTNIKPGRGARTPRRGGVGCGRGRDFLLGPVTWPGSFKSWENERVTPNAFQLAAYQTVFMQD